MQIMMDVGELFLLGGTPFCADAEPETAENITSDYKDVGLGRNLTLGRGRLDDL